MRRMSVAFIVCIALLIGLWAAVLSMPGLRKPDSVASATVAPPTITGIAPTSGQVGTQVRITGTVFGNTQGTSLVRFNGKAAAASSWSASQIVCAVPAGATTGQVTVTTTGGTSNGVTLTVTVPPPPPPASAHSSSTSSSTMRAVSSSQGNSLFSLRNNAITSAIAKRITNIIIDQ
jgi:uncharacterized protein (TIGR03437 family)